MTSSPDDSPWPRHRQGLRDRHLRRRSAPARVELPAHPQWLHHEAGRIASLAAAMASRRRGRMRLRRRLRCHSRELLRPERQPLVRWLHHGMQVGSLLRRRRQDRRRGVRQRQEQRRLWHVQWMLPRLQAARTMRRWQGADRLRRRVRRRIEELEQQRSQLARMVSACRTANAAGVAATASRMARKTATTAPMTGPTELAIPTARWRQGVATGCAVRLRRGLRAHHDRTIRIAPTSAAPQVDVAMARSNRPNNATTGRSSIPGTTAAARQVVSSPPTAATASRMAPLLIEKVASPPRNRRHHGDGIPA
jgi:hypothetical protein